MSGFTTSKTTPQFSAVTYSTNDQITQYIPILSSLFISLAITILLFSNYIFIGITSGSALLSSFKQLSSMFPGLLHQLVLYFIRSILKPRYLWKVSESGRVNMLVQDMNVPMVDKDQKEDRKKVLVDYFLEDRHNHEIYAYTFFFCEFLNFVNVLLQLLFMDFFLGGEFTTYGSDVISMTNLEQEQRSDPLSRVFPKVVNFVPAFFLLILESGPVLTERLN